MAVLIAKLPMLVIPHGRDQGDNAARVTERGAGLVVSRSASTQEIRAVLKSLLEEPSLRAAAQALGAAIAAEAEASTLIALDAIARGDDRGDLSEAVATGRDVASART
jgi:UDP:flavonoid glycosyltransferase YjiC (YdhE family)